MRSCSYCSTFGRIRHCSQGSKPSHGISYAKHWPPENGRANTQPTSMTNAKFVVVLKLTSTSSLLVILQEQFGFQWSAIMPMRAGLGVLICNTSGPITPAIQYRPPPAPRQRWRARERESALQHHAALLPGPAAASARGFFPVAVTEPKLIFCHRLPLSLFRCALVAANFPALLGVSYRSRLLARRLSRARGSSG
ncbi:hypothetical protein PR202_gb29524 [Eleusine coracana subsp. coracana]|uniref:Uncharacterized protein n=1 Tax=Eleusine coracana subsp. coracana TaxID=191504 RepID=A0AAV5G1S6_ELECO|nr:hypothetical protein PR202_gb29524 [Eleusine coracana subsp. coracana]